ANRGERAGCLAAADDRDRVFSAGDTGAGNVLVFGFPADCIAYRPADDVAAARKRVHRRGAGPDESEQERSREAAWDGANDPGRKASASELRHARRVSAPRL